MKFPWTLICIWACYAWMTPNALYAEELEITHPNNNAQLIEERLDRLNLPFSITSNGEVLSQINRYLTTGYKQTRYMLGRSRLYLPVVEHYVELYNLPEALKYLPVIESNLRPTAASQVGAIGLWQFIETTGQQYGLKINDYVDERRDPYKSSEAAARMLGTLYREFGDWTLVLAAYNCGPGRVKRAIRLARTNRYEDVQEFLPKETQQYIPRFIAAAYVFTYYDQHGIKPKFPSFELRETRTVQINDYISFREISEKCRVDLITLGFLNPSYLQRVIPKSNSGNIIILPAKCMPTFKQHIARRNRVPSESMEPPYGTFKHTHIVGVGETISKISNMFDLLPEQIESWNQLADPKLVVNQEIELFLPKSILMPRP